MFACRTARTLSAFPVHASQLCKPSRASVQARVVAPPMPKAMKKVKLGTSDLEVSYACLGTMLMGTRNTEEESVAMLDYFYEQGGNFLDTAELYAVPSTDESPGLSEEFIGRWMQKRQCRAEMVIATKVAGFMTTNRISANRTAPKDPEAPNPRLTKEQIHAACEGSLRRLQTDYVDLYYLHWPDRYVPGFGKHKYDVKEQRDGAVSFEEQVTAIGELLAAGKVKAWGLSNETAYGVTMFCETAKRLGVALPCCIQNDYSLNERHFDMDTAEACHMYGLQLCPYGVLSGGYLSGKYLHGQEPEGCRHSKGGTGFQWRYAQKACETALLKYEKLAQSKGLSCTELAVAWVASRWHMGAVITGQTSVEQLAEYLPAVTDIKLDEETLEQIEKIHMEDRNPGWSD